ncbi:tetratricopeptide repeat protein [Corynebacterium mayonis]|uniref:tetratricopeptide repeat protein n=1 Tax=Corynebacterium mayonis TaxID=3062461 RepID=UPI0031406F3F
MADFVSGAVDLSALKNKAGGGAVQGGSTAAFTAQEDGFEPFITATQDSFEDEVLRRSAQVPVIVLVGSEHSGESGELKTTFAQLAAGQRAFRVAYVNAEDSPLLAQMLGVQVVPTVIALAAARPVASFEGNQPREELKAWVEAVVAQLGPQLEGLPDEKRPQDTDFVHDPRLADATASLNRGDFDAASTIYDAVLADDPSNTEVRQAKATVAVLKRLDLKGRTTDPVAEAEADPGDVDKQLAAADAEVVAGAPEKAFTRLVALVKTSPRAKERLLDLFTLFEPGDPRVIEARTKLASALF